jgi:alkanesulfonate monooxygenase SsuD/methylene tetrahydromethanopterin reductase-like flavin-dependent oxidoreductase (luciferase family)
MGVPLSSTMMLGTTRQIPQDRHLPCAVPCVGGEPAAGARPRHGASQHLDRLNYHEAWIGEHHSGGFEIIACPEMFIAAAAERTRHIRLGTGVVSLPYHNPFTLAGPHDAARLHDARPRHVRRRARLAHL